MKKPLKKSLSGLEWEFFILNNKGGVVPNTANFIKKANKKFPELNIVPEAGTSMIEVSSYPNVNVLDSLIDILEKAKKLIEIADKMDFKLYPAATYPGKIKPTITNLKKYKEQVTLFGKDRASNAALVCGFHYHYTLPKGVFDTKTKFLKQVKNSKLKQAMIDSYNLSIAFDPALICMLQSSPFVQGKFLGKDSRVLIYRGGKKLNYMDGKYSTHQQLGGLPPYKQTLNDLIFSIKKRQTKWTEMMEKKGLNPAPTIKKTNVLDFTWNPVRINKLGTIELRGMDMNHPKYTMAMASLLKFIFRKIYRDFYTVMPSDIGLDEPFKIEGNIIHVPPHTYVRNHLQKEAAYKGFQSREVYNYTKRFYRLCKAFLEGNYNKVVRPLYDILDKKESVSDIILKRAKKLGSHKDDALPTDIAAEIAIKSSEKLLSEVDDTEDKLYNAYS